MNTTEKECPVCHRQVVVVNYAVEPVRSPGGATLRTKMEVGYLARHWRPGIARTSKCSGSFGGWVR